MVYTVEKLKKGFFLKTDDACSSFTALEVNQKNILVWKICGDKYSFCRD
jgi:hypothetical protein